MNGFPRRAGERHDAGEVGARRTYAEYTPDATAAQEVDPQDGGARAPDARRAGAGGVQGDLAEDGGGLPEAGWRRLAGRSLWASAVKSLALVVPAVAGLIRFLTSRDWEAGAVVAMCAGTAVLIVAGVVAYDVVRLRMTRWRLTPERLELRSGIVVRHRRSIPRDRVRSVDLRADPVLRAFGLTVVKVGTGEHSAEGGELSLDPLTRHDAEALRRTLLLGNDAAAAPGDEADAPLAELRWSWIKYAPLSVWTFTGAAAVLGVAYKALNGIGFEVFTKETAEGLWNWVTTRPLLSVPLLLVANAAVGVLGAILLFAESWGRYRLEREPGRLRLRRGLLTTRSLTLEERRLRGVEISEPLLLRLGGGARVKAIATGLGKAAENETEDVAALTPPLPLALARDLAAQVAGLAALPRTPSVNAWASSSDVAPAIPAAAHDGAATTSQVRYMEGAAKLSEAGRVADAARPFQAAGAAGRIGGVAGLATSAGGSGVVAHPAGAGGSGLAAHPTAARRRRLGRAVITVAVLAVVAWPASWLVPWAWLRPWAWAVPLAALPLGLWLAVESARSLGHALGARHLVTRRGAVVRRTVALDRAGISGWTVTESFFQRRNGLVTVSATTAAGNGHYDVVDVGRGDGLDLAANAVPGLLEPFLDRPRRTK